MLARREKKRLTANIRHIRIISIININTSGCPVYFYNISIGKIVRDILIPIDIMLYHMKRAQHIVFGMKVIFISCPIPCNFSQLHLRVIYIKRFADTEIIEPDRNLVSYFFRCNSRTKSPLAVTPFFAIGNVLSVCHTFLLPINTAM